MPDAEPRPEPQPASEPERAPTDGLGVAGSGSPAAGDWNPGGAGGAGAGGDDPADGEG
ncbi:hypothetical protein [Phenylobacterium sp.]|jgi:hypothetical protein|uniref:hypothetical protein n=1 Tax=Phenylobacterium sp. TaxID=1871053 RepID=UPI002F95FCFF